ncbi:hydrolase [Streptomyces sp. ODS28]|uniref:alpha/beta hydrolase family protein n=1 Tax=Streptomyces sp. ODS28 TaxID=3136688 RepID=UPI0031EF4C66
MLSRRAAVFSAAALALTAASGTAHAAQPTAPRSGRVRLRLPAPGGPYEVGTLSRRLVDISRGDPWHAAGHVRELMVSVRYPARCAGGGRRAPQFLPGEAAGFDALNNLGGVPAGKVDWAATLTHARTGAPVRRGPRPWPVLLYSPGVGDPRCFGSTLCDALASHGYAVVTVDHTYDGSAVEFPGGRVERTVLPEEFEKTGGDPEKVRALLRKTLEVRVADLRFVLDALPGALPPDLLGVLDLARVGAFGQSAGGFAALQAMYEDRRIGAGADLDGVLAYVQEDSEPGHLSPVAAEGLDRPFLLAGKDGNSRRTMPSWASLWEHSTGRPREELVLRGAAHATYTDAVAVVPQIARALDLPRGTVTELIGTIAPHRAIAAQRTALTGFFGRTVGRG